MNFVVDAVGDKELTESDCLGIMNLINAIWPQAGKSSQELADRMYESIRAGNVKPGSIHYLIRDENETIIAHANAHGRDIKTIDGKITILAICGVCVIPDYRKFGLGAKLINAAFTRVDNGTFALSLFQTSVPGFYEKLGAKQVNNKFINSLNTDTPETNPWWDPNIMIYPASHPWNDEIVDLLGPGW